MPFIFFCSLFAFPMLLLVSSYFITFHFSSAEPFVLLSFQSFVLVYVVVCSRHNAYLSVSSCLYYILCNHHKRIQMPSLLSFFPSLLLSCGAFHLIRRAQGATDWLINIKVKIAKSEIAPFLKCSSEDISFVEVEESKINGEYTSEYGHMESKVPQTDS